jgi:1-phosphofructokinase family hexose kinase
MESKGRIITIGLSPAWDVSCRGRDLDWGRHVEIDEQVVRPAGKALNISYALAWLGRRSIAAGLWGREDYGRMKAAVARLGGRVLTHMTPAEGATRRNITVVDTLHRREMHLRQRSELASKRTLRRLNADLRKLVRRGDTCVLAGATPDGELLEPFLDLVRTCRDARAQVVVDTHGPTLAAVVHEGLASMISPNVEELRGLLGRTVANSPVRLVAAARPLLTKVGRVLVSRGPAGAIIVTKERAWMGRPKTRRRALSAVGCGDYLLAGFLAGMQDSANPPAALAIGLKVAAGRAWGWTETKTWPQVSEEIAVAVESV